MLSCVVVFVAALAPTSSHGQFYAPDTEYHDPVQRVFVVEAARVLAWAEADTNVAEVTYKFQTKSDSNSVWEIQWANGAGKSIKTATVTYGSDVLKGGPEFYRSTFKQLWRAGWKNPPALEAAQLTERFWRGAARMGLSREESLSSLFPLTRASEQKGRTESAPELAGLLVHAALPGYAARVTLDRMLLARGAAWLALAEQACGAKLNPLWAPILFQAGREADAIKAWPPNEKADSQNATPQQTGWNIWLSKPVSRKVFLFAASSPKNLSMAMPMLAYDVIVNGTGSTLAELIGPIAGTEERLQSLHNYGPLFARWTNIGGGRISEGAWATIGRLVWLKLLSSYSPAADDFRGYSAALTRATNTIAKADKPDQGADASLFGLPEMSPVLRLGNTEGVGKLIPVGAVTARDLLNYGWEMTGWQMGSRYYFVNYAWGIHDLAESIYKKTTAEIEGLMPFFKNEYYSGIAHYDESLKRLQMIEGLYYLVGFSVPPTDTNHVTAAGARLFVSRWWLRPSDVEWQVRTLWDAEAGGDISPLLRTSSEQAGSLGTAFALRYLISLNAEAISHVPRAAELRYSLAKAMPQPSTLTARILAEHEGGANDNLLRAQQYERMYWQNPDAGLQNWIIYNYLYAGAFKSARRFYSQARENFEDPVGFSNGGGMYLFMLGYCQNDPKLLEQVLEDSNSGSFDDMIMHIWDAAIRDDANQLRAATRELVERYETDKASNSEGKQLLKFLPLLPALRDPTHPQRRQALEFFGKIGSWTTLRLIWIEKFKIPTADAIVLLGGRENNGVTRVIIAYLEKDRARAVQEFSQLVAKGDTRSEMKILSVCLLDRLEPHALQDKDLKPATGGQTIRRLVLQQLESRSAK